MATMEKLFAQIFERKKGIVEQVRHQALLFDQHLASKCLLEGIAPPPWLFPSAPSLPTELNKEELISELLLPCPPPAIPYSTTYCPVYKKPFIDKGDCPNGFYAEVHNSNIAFEAGDRLSVSPQLPINDLGGPLGGVEKPDSSSASSPQDQREAQIPNITPEPAHSLPSLQRSKSRQRALELRNSAKAVRSQLHVDNSTGLFASGNRGSQIASPRPDHVDELERVESVHNNYERCEVEEANIDNFLSEDTESRKEEIVSGPSLLPGSQPAVSCCSSDLVPCDQPALLSENEEVPDGFNTEVNASIVAADGQSDLLQLLVQDAGCGSNGVPDLEAGVISPQDQRNAGVSDINPEPFQSLARVQRSKSRQRALEIRDSAKAAKSRLSVENNIGNYSTVDNRCVIATPLSGQVNESKLVKPAKVYDESCELEEPKVRSVQSKEKDSNYYSGRITRSRSSCQQPNSLRVSSRLGNTTSVDNRSVIATPLSGQVHKSELVITANVYNESCEVEEAKVCVVQSKEKDNNYYSGRITRSRSSCQQPNSLRVSSHLGNPTSVGRSSRDGNKLDCVELSGVLIEENPTSLRSFGSVGVGSCPRQVGGQTTDAVSASPSLKEGDGVQSNVGRSPIDKWDHVEQHSTERWKLSPVRISHSLPEDVDELGMVKPSGYYESCVVQEKKVGDVHSSRKGSNLCSGRITGSQSSKVSPVRIISPVDEMNHAEQPVTGGSKSSPVGISSSLERDELELSRVRNRSPVDKMDVDEFMKVGSELSPAKISLRLLEQVDQLGLVKPADLCSGSCVEEEINVGDVQIKDDGNISSGRSTRSQSAKSSLVRIRSSIFKMDQVEQHMTGGSKSSPVSLSSPLMVHVDRLELVKPVDICSKNCMVEEANIGNLQSNNEGNGFCSGRITRLQSSSQEASSMRESLKVDNSSGTERSSSDGKNVDSSKSSQQIGKKLRCLGKKLSSGEDGSSAQLKRRRIEIQLIDSPSASPKLRDGAIALSNVIGSPVAANELYGGCHITEGSQSSPKLLVDKGELSLEERDRSGFSPFTFSCKESELPLMPSLVNHVTADSKVCSDVKAGEADPTSIIYDSGEQETKQDSEVLLHLDDKFEHGNAENLTSTDRGLREGTENGIGSPHRQSMELNIADQAVSEFERFIMQTESEQSDIAGNDISLKLNLPKTTIERASLLEQLCKSACMQTPLSHFSTTYKLHGASNLYQSVPNGLLECIDMKSNLEVNDDIGKQLKASYSYFKKEVNQTLQERSHSDCLPISNAQSTWDIKKPFTSPVGKLWDRIMSNSGSSEKRGSLNAELPCISEENENTDEVVEVLQEGISKELMQTSVKRKPLADITENQNVPESASEAEVFAARNSLESVNTEYSFVGTCNGVNQKLGQDNSSKKGLTNKAKVSNSISIGEYGTNRISESVQGRFSKPKLSGKPSLRKEGPSLGGREAKRNNIVSNVTSFVPLVQQKQAAPIITGKRDVRVKALEAAEAAKRLAQEKENERKMKKEALKLERARLEQKHLKQMELEKKQKEEERKKKEADMAARKRQREEEEKKEKERKRNRVMEARKQQQLRENEEKLRAKKEKELKCRRVDERPKDMKTSRIEAGKDEKEGKEMGDENLRKFSKTGPTETMVSTCDSIKASIVLEASTDWGDNSKVKSNLEKATVDNIFTSTYKEESYDISPYKESDDEDEDDDDISNSKFVPSWASRTCLARAVASQQNINPEVMFTPESFCSISEVLMPRRLQQK